MHMLYIGSNVSSTVGGSVSAVLVVILVVTAIVVLALVWIKKHNSKTRVHGQGQRETHQVNPVYTPPQTEAHQVRDTFQNSSFEDIY